MIPKRYRGLSAQNVKSLFGQGTKENFSGGYLRWRLSEEQGPRLAVLISSKIAPKATQRSFLRRSIQAAALPILEELDTPVDISIVWTRKEAPEQKELRKELKKILLRTA